jgi:L,D-peptidoglycan transpeptidase YkuD (ErfK/YbiS/YcfS/YnhG family)
MIESNRYKGSLAMASAPPRPMRSRHFTSVSYIVNAAAVVRVRRSAGERSRGRVTVGHLRLPCALGKGGVTAFKREGDGATPRGRFALRRVWLRRTAGLRAPPRLPVRRARPEDGWCDDPRHPRYNRPIRLPFAASCERMWRDDHLYDVVVEIGWNDRPAVRGRGSAIFMHLARPGCTPTEGCVALARRDMLRLLPKLSRRTRIDIA